MTPRSRTRLVVTAAVASLATLTLALALLAVRGTGSGTDGSGASTTTAVAPTTSVPAPTSTTEPAPAPATTAAVTTSATPAPSTTTGTAGQEAVLLAAGDIASCSSSGDEATAALLAARPSAVVATLGDNVYERGTPAEFSRCYDPSWGAARPRTRPSPGNHDYGASGAGGYFGYFGAAAGEPGKGYYSYDLGPWHVVALNSNCSVVSCERGSAQERWLRADLAAHPRSCTLAYWHHPRFSSGTVHGSTTAVAPLWQALHDANADLVLAGHEHHYERLGPLDPSGALDPGRGVRSFVVGTGGRSHYAFGPAIAGSEIRHRGTFGVLELVLQARGFTWYFVPEPGESFSDSGSAPCH